MTASTSKTILIVGGSLTGLMTGIILSRLGHNVLVLERTRTEALQDQGAGITMASVIPPIAAEFRKLGFTSGAPLFEFLQNHDRTGTQTYATGDALLYLKRDGTLRYKAELPPAFGSTSWDILYVVLRANFDGRYERSYIQPAARQSGDGRAEYFSGAKVTGLRDIGEKVQVTYFGSTGEETTSEVDFVIGADGSSSTIRRLMDPEVGKKYAGYVAFRGAVKEAYLSDEVQNLYKEKVVWHFSKHTQVLTYNIPDHNGSLKPGERLANIVWYFNATESEKKRLLTDSEGNEHRFSLGIGKIDQAIKASQKEMANQALPSCFAEQWSKIENPFIQAITDSLATRAVFMEGKVLLVGDALAGLRPHTTAGANQGAMHALLLDKVFGKEKMSTQEWEEKVLGFAAFASEMGQRLGDLSQFGQHPLAKDHGDVTASWERK